MTPDEIAKYRATHDEVPLRKRGRPMRKVRIGDCLKARKAREDGLKCSMCPKWMRNGFCPILAQHRRGEVAACEYGKLLIAQEKRNGQGTEGHT